METGGHETRIRRDSRSEEKDLRKGVMRVIATKGRISNLPPEFEGTLLVLNETGVNDL